MVNTAKSAQSKGSSIPSKAFIWPPIIPAKGDLQFKEIVPGLIIIDGLFTPSSEKWVSFLQSPDSPVRLQPSPGAKRGEASRTNDRFSIEDSTFAQMLWQQTKLQQLCETDLPPSSKIGRHGQPRKPLGLNSNIRLYRYREGAYFGPHYDDDFRDSKTGWQSEWTLLIYLTGEEDGVKGGETAFYPNKSRKVHSESGTLVGLSRGRAVLHRHGADCMLHEGKPVLAGVKWVLRSDVMFG